MSDAADTEITPPHLAEALSAIRLPVDLVPGLDGAIHPHRPGERAAEAMATLPPVHPEWLGDRAFLTAHGCRFPYVVGEMARGLATANMVIAAVRAGFCGFFGSAGLPPEEIRGALRQVTDALGPEAPAWGANLIHAPQTPEAERAVVDVFLDAGVRRVSASAFMALSREVVRYVAKGLSLGPDGTVNRAHHVFAKVSRAEVARHFMAPPPAGLLRDLVAAGDIDARQAELASRVPVACDITAEADSGGHTDNRAASVLLPELIGLRGEVADAHGLDPATIRIGLAGGIATPHSVAAAFAGGAAYVLTGSINQAATESGLSRDARELLAQAGPADVAMAPAADMFEQGVKVQVLRRGTLFAMRGNRMAEIYRNREDFAACSPDERAFLEKCFGETLDSAWTETRDWLSRTRSDDLAAVDATPRRQMALVIRRYLFSGAQWAREGRADRRADYQIWCGPAMGGFNRWVAGTTLADLDQRSVAVIGWTLLDGAARLVRAQALRAAGVAVPSGAFDVRPRPLANPHRAVA